VVNRAHRLLTSVPPELRDRPNVQRLHELLMDTLPQTPLGHAIARSLAGAYPGGQAGQARTSLADRRGPHPAPHRGPRADQRPDPRCEQRLGSCPDPRRDPAKGPRPGRSAMGLT